MTALSIANLAIDNDLDKAALTAVSGGGRVGTINLGWSPTYNTGFKYKSRSIRFVGYKNVLGLGRVRHYLVSKKFQNVQTRYHRQLWLYK